MPLADITIDTNVFLHASNPIEPRSANAKHFLISFLGCSTLLCIDNGFNLSPALNGSQIWHEYLEHFLPGDLGTAVVTQVAQTERIFFVSLSVQQHVSKKINQNVSDKSDRKFVKAAFNSMDKILVSHDDKDFPKRTRKELKKELGVSVVDARDAADLL